MRLGIPQSGEFSELGFPFRVLFIRVPHYVGGFEFCVGFSRNSPIKGDPTRITEKYDGVYGLGFRAEGTD